MGEYLIRLPWPPSALNTHAKGHWRPKAKATKKYRHDAWALAQEASVKAIPGAILEFTFCPPDKRRRDIQNMPGMMKAGIDGIADAMGCDDSKFRPHFPDHFAEPTKGGCVLVHIKPSVTNIEMKGSIS